MFFPENGVLECAYHLFCINNFNQCRKETLALIAKLFSKLSNVSVGLLRKKTFMLSSQQFKVLKRAA